MKGKKNLDWLRNKLTCSQSQTVGVTVKIILRRGLPISIIYFNHISQVSKEVGLNELLDLLLLSAGFED